MTGVKTLECVLIENSYVSVIVIKKLPYCASDSDAVNRAIELLKGV